MKNKTKKKKKKKKNKQKKKKSWNQKIWEKDTINKKKIETW